MQPIASWSIFAVQELHALLLSLFASSDELKQFITLGPGGDELSTAIDGGSRSQRALQTLQALRSRGMLDAAFFDRLVTERPFRADEIRGMAAQFLGQGAPSAHTGTGRALGSPKRLDGGQTSSVHIGDGSSMKDTIVAGGNVTVHHHAPGATPSSPRETSDPEED